MHTRPCEFVARAGVRDRYELSAMCEPLVADNDRAVAVGDGRAIELRDHLFGAAGRKARHWRERVGDVEDGKAQNAPRKLNSLIAAAARVCQIAVPARKPRRS